MVLAIYSPWRDLNRQARLTGVTLIFVCALWMLSHAFEIGLPVASYKEALVGVQLALGTIALTFWLFYIVHYLGPRKLLTRRVYILFSIMPLVAIVALSTNNIYGLMLTEIGIDSQNPYLPLQPAYGLIYWACMVYVAALTLTGSFIIIWNIIRRRFSYSREWIFLLIAAIIPLLTAFIEVIGLTSSLKISVGITPWAACIGAVILILNLPQFRLEQVIPVARDVIFERIGDCIIVLDKQNRVLDLNPAAEQLIGYGISDALGLSIERLWPYQSNPAMPFNKMIKTGEELIYERDGEQRTYGLNISTVTDSGGRLTSQVILLTDITGRKQAEEELRKSEQQYRILFEGASEGIGIVQDGMYKLVNPKLVQLLGYTEEEILATSVIQFLHPESKDLVMERHMRRLNGEIFENVYPFRAVNKAGDTRWVEISTVLIEWEGRPATLDYYSDITDRKQMEDLLKDSEVKYRLLAENTVDGVWLIDMNLKLVYCSPASAKQSGFTLQEIKGMPMEQYFTPESLKVVAEAFLEIMPRVEADPDYNPVLTLELEFYKKDGTSFWAECKFSIIRDEQGKPASILGQGRDITERRLADEKLEKSYASLKKTLDDAINTMVQIVELRDPYTAGHQRKVADLATAIGREMKLDDDRINQLTTAATIHDIGKMYVPSDILSKPGQLGDIEFSLIKTHSQSGYDIVKSMDFPCSIAQAVLQHHERLDGSGYPNQLKGEDMLLEAKILAVADVVEAMASHRPYRQALGIDKALEEISKNRGRLYDPDVVDACLKLFKERDFKFEG